MIGHTSFILFFTILFLILIFFLSATVSGNVIVNTVAGVPAATFQPINKRLASPVIPGTLTVSRLHTSCTSGFILVAHLDLFLALAVLVIRNCTPY